MARVQRIGGRADGRGEGGRRGERGMGNGRRKEGEERGKEVRNRKER